MELMDFSKLATQARTLKDVYFYPTIDISLISIAVVMSCRVRKTAAVVSQVSSLAQCCYAMLTALAIIQYSNWTEFHFPLSVAVLPLLTLQPAAYYPFQLTNLVGMYRSLSGHISADIWHQLLYALMHLYLLLTNLDAQGQSIVNDLKRLVFYTQERRLLSIQKSRDIELDDLDKLPERMRLSSIAKEFKYDVNESFFVIRAIFRATWRSMIPIYILDSLLNIAIVGSSVLNSRILYIIDLPSEHSWYEGYVIIILAFFVNILKEQFIRVNYLLSEESDRIIKAIQLELFRLPLTNSGLRKDHTYVSAKYAAKILRNNFGNLQHIIGAVAGTIGTVVLIYRQISWLAFVPVAVSIAINMVAWVLETLFGGSYEWQAEIKNDYNIDVEEIHHNIKSIKMFGWERMYVDPVLKKHWNKADNTRVFPWYAPVVRFIWFLLKIIDLVSEQLSVYIAIHIFTTVGADSAPAISNADIFQLETLMNDLLHKAKELCINFKVLRRVVGCNYILEKFLKGDFVDTLPQYSLELGEQKKDACSSEPSMTLDNCDFALKKNETVLKNISFNAKNGELVAVVGKTGSGKSSLLLSICGEVEMTKGSGAVFGSVALMEQTPWIINDTIRENILFGREYDEYHYKCVVEACALTDDIKTWTNGDKTVIGERGINISGGQRARLALARTVYSKADIYVLDDPLSAVDAHVKRHILDNVIMDSGLLSGKIRVVSVNAKSLLPYFDKVVRLNSGNSLVTQQNPQKYLPATNIISLKENKNKPKEPGFIASSENVPESPTGECADNQESDPDSKENPSNIMDSNTKIHEWNKWDNMKYVLEICGPTSLIMIALAGFARPITRYIVDGYKLDSLKSNTRNGNASNDAVLKYLRMNMLGKIIHIALGMVSLFIRQTLSTKHLKTRLKSMFIDSLIHAPLSFFDSATSMDLSSAYEFGINSVSNGIPSFLMTELSNALGILLSLYRVTRNAPLLLLMVPFLGWYSNEHTSQFTLIGDSLSNIWQNTTISINTTRSIISGGKRLIRLLNVEPYFTKLYMDGKDTAARIIWPRQALNSLVCMIHSSVDWFSKSAFNMAILVQNHLFGYNTSSGGLVTYIDLTEMLINNTTTLFKLPNRLFSFNGGINSFRQYMDIDRDDNSVENTVEPPSSWPSAGKIEFRSFSMKYRSDLEYALKDINLTINPGEKVGIVGRTGAGKTSLSRAVFRLIKSNSCEGSILIDGADIFSINPDILRPKMGTIPQESTMFKGSFKQNLDPLLEYSIEDMWAALVKCNITEYVEPKHDRSDGSSGNSDYYYNEDNEQLKEEIAEWNLEWEKADWRKRVFLSLFVSKPRLEKAINRKVKHGLDKNIGSHSRFSSGQQQLFSLCRLLMRKRKIIVLDEATADVDLETDQEMQKLFRSEFKDCTVLTIAHRLETIMGCDRIIVMDKGTVAEFGPPKDLIEQGGYFAELVKANDF